MERNHGFPKRERIVSKKQIETLFNGGNSCSVTAFPLRAVYMQKERQDTHEAVEVLVSVSKKRFHHAVDRNRVKRQVREAYRLQKSVIAERVPQDKTLDIAFIWLSDHHTPSADVSSRVKILLERIGKRIKA